MLIHGLVTGSRVNGPGLRAVVYFQGCTLSCRFCWNKDTHTFSGEQRSVDDVAHSVVCAHHERPLDGVTFSGGEPMQQADALLALMESLRDRLPALSFGMYSGYSEPELASSGYWCRSDLTQREKQDLWQRIRGLLDFAVLGRYVAGKPSALALRTTTNQKLVLFSGRYEEEDFSAQEVEVHLDAHGTVQMTGFPTAGLLG
ncbi:MAG TPA: 4Fe-4S single cluster domain-containing protein [Terriglobia bacterium]|nr:4Fe-4S single cluster domain-containing protein [Terriglobia bacterium]